MLSNPPSSIMATTCFALFISPNYWSPAKESNLAPLLCRQVSSSALSRDEMGCATGNDPAPPDSQSGMLNLHTPRTIRWSLRSVPTRRPAVYETAALPTELRRRNGGDGWDLTSDILCVRQAL